MGFFRNVYSLAARLHHFLTAWNTGGEGIHSPYLFEWVRWGLTDRHAYYCWAIIEQAAHRSILPATPAEPGRREVQVLFRLVNWLGHTEGRALRLVQYRVGHGILAAYIASVHRTNTVHVFEPNSQLSHRAGQLWQTLHLSNCQCSDDDICTSFPPMTDLCILSAADHYATAVFQTALDHMHDKSIIAVTALRSSPTAMRTWHRMSQDDRVTTSMDLGQLGLIFLDPHYLRKHYRLKL